MNDPPKAVPSAENSWPPPPTLPPPQPVRPRLFLLRLPIWGVVLMDMGFGLAEAGITCLRRWATHHAIQWADAGIFGALIFVMFLIGHLWLRSVMLKREQDATE